MDFEVDLQAVADDPETVALFAEWSELRRQYAGTLPPRRMSADEAIRVALGQFAGDVNPDEED